MTIVFHDDVAEEEFPRGATYRTLVGDEGGSTPIRVGIQTSPPGYRTATHSHPYLEVLTILEGTGEVWIEGMAETARLAPGMTLVLEPNRRHWFRATGTGPLKTYGVHASPRRVLRMDDD